MIRIESILGLSSDARFAEALHRLEHEGAVEFVTLAEADTQRHRLRATTDRGTECAIAIPRDQRLCDGAVLLLDSNRAIVLRTRQIRWLALQPHDVAAALEIGYLAGNMHWKVEFEGPVLRVVIQGAVESYLDRLVGLLGRAAVTLPDGTQWHPHAPGAAADNR